MVADPNAPAAPQLPNPLTLLPIPDPKPIQAFLDGLQQGVKGVGDGFIATVNQAVGGLNGTVTQGLDAGTKMLKAPFDAINQGIAQAQAGAPGGGQGPQLPQNPPAPNLGARNAPSPPRVNLPQLPTPREFTI